MRETAPPFVKRALDVIVATAALIVLSPVLLLVAVVVWLSMGLPVLFRQERLGLGGRPFVLLKFRSMTEATDAVGVLLPDAQRLTALGRFLRRTTLDEVPELVNVLRGEMSLVGPRPLLPEYDALYTPLQRRRHEVPPGMAGPVLVKGRNVLSWDEKLALDVWYVDHWSFALDLRILFQTLVMVLTGRGVSAPGHATMPKFEGSRPSRNDPGPGA
jgi:sugar transferase EpsL